MKQLIKPLYRLLHDFLFATSSLNPFFKQHHNHKKVTKGFIGDEHLDNPALDEKLLSDLKEYYLNASLSNKQRIVGLIFPEKFAFSENNFQIVPRRCEISLWVNLHTITSSFQEDFCLKMSNFWFFPYTMSI